MLKLSALLDPDVELDPRTFPLGNQVPTHRLCPPAEFTHGHDALWLAGHAGYDLMQCQRDGLIDCFGANQVLQQDGSYAERWAAKEDVEVASRRNGKSVRLEVVILTGLFLLGEKIMYTAHRDETAKEIFDRVVAAIFRTPDLWAELVDSGPRRTNGQREIRLKSGAVCLFRTRTLDTARGTGFNRLILDEVQNLGQEYLDALLPLLSGEKNAQLNYAGSAGGRHSTVLANLWRRAFTLRERLLLYRGWHAAEPNDLEGVDLDDLDLAARVNPRLGRGLDYEWVAKEAAGMLPAGKARERFGIATYPRAEGTDWVIPRTAWTNALDPHSAAFGPLVLVPEADPELQQGSINVAGRRTDGAMHIEVVSFDPGVHWLPAELKRLAVEHGAQVWVDPVGPCGFLIPDLKDLGIEVHQFTTEQVRNACSWIYLAANPHPDPADPEAGTPPPGVYHRGGDRLTAALAAARTRKLQGGWAWNRYVEVNQGPIVGCTLASYAVVLSERVAPPPPAPIAVRAPRERTPADRSPRHAATAVDLSTARF